MRRHREVAFAFGLALLLFVVLQPCAVLASTFSATNQASMACMQGAAQDGCCAHKDGAYVSCNLPHFALDGHHSELTKYVGALPTAPAFPLLLPETPVKRNAIVRLGDPFPPPKRFASSTLRLLI